MSICIELSFRLRKFTHAFSDDAIAISFPFIRVVWTTVSIIDLIGKMEGAPKTEE